MINALKRICVCIVLMVSANAIASTNIVCNSCEVEDFYNKMFSWAEGSVTSQGYYDDVVVANLQTGKVSAWSVSATYFMNGDDDPEVRVTANRINIPADVSKAVNDAYESELMALTKKATVVPAEVFESAFDVVRIQTNQAALNDWFFAEHGVLSRLESLASKVGGIFNGAADGAVFHFEFPDGSKMSLKVKVYAENDWDLLYVKNSGEDKYDNPIPEPQTSIVGIIYGFDGTDDMEAFIEQLEKYYPEVEWVSFSGGTAREQYIKISKD